VRFLKGYIQDLAQSFHARALPGVSTARLLWNSVLNMVGINGPYDRAVTNVTNEHMLLESHVYSMMRAAFDGGEGPGMPLLAALGDRSGDAGAAPYEGHYIKNIVSREASDRAEGVIDALNGIIADRSVFDRTAELDREGKFSPAAVINGTTDEAKRRFIDTMSPVMKSIGIHSRAFLSSATLR